MRGGIIGAARVVVAQDYAGGVAVEGIEGELSQIDEDVAGVAVADFHFLQHHPRIVGEYRPKFFRRFELQSLHQGVGSLWRIDSDPLAEVGDVDAPSKFSRSLDDARLRRTDAVNGLVYRHRIADEPNEVVVAGVHNIFAELHRRLVA